MPNGPSGAPLSGSKGGDGEPIWLRCPRQLGELGADGQFQIPRKIICRHCHGSGANTPEDIHECGQCGGRGVIVQRHQVFPGMFTNVQMQYVLPGLRSLSPYLPWAYLPPHEAVRDTDGARCNACAGAGQRIARPCPACKSAKVENVQHTLAVHIPAGAPEGFEEVFTGEADESVDWEAGDVLVRVRSQKAKGAGGWGRHESGILGRVTLGLGEVSE